MKRVVKAYGNHSFAHGKKARRTKKHWIIIAAAIAAAAIIVSATAPGIAWMLGLFIVTAGLGYMKRFFQSAPVDLEVLSFGSAYLAVYHSFFLAIVFAVFGTLLAEATSGGIRELSWVKVVSVLVTAVAAAIFANGPVGMFIAVLLGLATQYVLMLVLMQDAVMNFLRRLTNAAFQAYIIFLLLPLFD